MTEKNKVKLIRELINKVYNHPNLTEELLNEIDTDVKTIADLVDENKAYRELLVLLDAAKQQSNLIARNNFKYAILSALEKEYKKIAIELQ